jgi:hypothetical protein
MLLLVILFLNNERKKLKKSIDLWHKEYQNADQKYLDLLCEKTKEKSNEKPNLTKDANHLLAELLTGGAVVIVQVSNPSEIFTWSPRDNK